MKITCAFRPVRSGTTSLPSANKRVPSTRLRSLRWSGGSLRGHQALWWRRSSTTNVLLINGSGYILNWPLVSRQIEIVMDFAPIRTLPGYGTHRTPLRLSSTSMPRNLATLTASGPASSPWRG